MNLLGLDAFATRSRRTLALAALSFVVSSCDFRSSIRFERLDGCDSCESGDLAGGVVAAERGTIGSMFQHRVLRGGGHLIASSGRLYWLDADYRVEHTLELEGDIEVVVLADDDAVVAWHGRHERVTCVSAAGDVLWRTRIDPDSGQYVGIMDGEVAVSGDTVFLRFWSTFDATIGATLAPKGVTLLALDRLDGRPVATFSAAGEWPIESDRRWRLRAVATDAVVGRVPVPLASAIGVDTTDVVDDEVFVRFDRDGSSSRASDPFTPPNLPEGFSFDVAVDGSTAFFGQSTDSSVVLGGQVVELGGRPVVVGLLAPDGSLRWAVPFGGSTEPRSTWRSASPRAFDDHVVITLADGPPSNAYSLVRVDSTGIVWSHRFSGAGVTAPAGVGPPMHASNGNVLVLVGLPSEKDPDSPETPRTLTVDGEAFVTTLGHALLEFVP